MVYFLWPFDEFWLVCCPLSNAGTVPASAIDNNDGSVTQTGRSACYSARLINARRKVAPGYQKCDMKTPNTDANALSVLWP